MALNSTEFHALNLFQSVNHNVSVGRVFCVCHSKLESETQAVVPILALIMETKFRPRVWRWFFSLSKGCYCGIYVDRGTWDS